LSGSLPGFATSTLAFLLLAASGWIGGELVFKHKVGVMEHADPKAGAIAIHPEVTDGGS
jgi:uncharacterized membrane protein